MKISVYFTLGSQSNLGVNVFLLHLLYIEYDRKYSLFEEDYSLMRCDTCFKFHPDRRLNNIWRFLAQPTTQRKNPF